MCDSPSAAAAAAADAVFDFAPTPVPAGSASSALVSAFPANPAPSPPPFSRSYMHASAEVYGFCLWCSTFVAGALFLLWAFTPDAVLQRLGFSYYPSKYWAVALPAWGALTLSVVPLIYGLLNAANTLPLTEKNLLEDAFTRRQREQRRKKRMQQQVQQQEQHAAGGHSASSPSALAMPPLIRDVSDPLSIPDCVDLPLADINELLFGSGGGSVQAGQSTIVR